MSNRNCIPDIIAFKKEDEDLYSFIGGSGPWLTEEEFNILQDIIIAKVWKEYTPAEILRQIEIGMKAYRLELADYSNFKMTEEFIKDYMGREEKLSCNVAYQVLSWNCKRI